MTTNRAKTRALFNSRKNTARSSTAIIFIDFHFGYEYFFLVGGIVQSAYTHTLSKKNWIPMLHTKKTHRK